MGILKFKLPEEREDFELAQKAGKMQVALWNIDQELRRQIKYDDKLSEEVLKKLEEIRKFVLSEAQDLLD